MLPNFSIPQRDIVKRIVMGAGTEGIRKQGQYTFAHVISKWAVQEKWPRSPNPCKKSRKPCFFLCLSTIKYEAVPVVPPDKINIHPFTPLEHGCYVMLPVNTQVNKSQIP